MSLVDATSIILGLAVFGQWCGLLRFLSYFDKYNMLLITLRLSMPSVMRFAVCAGILYISFLLCGWLVFGPYHPKVGVCVCVCVCVCVLCIHKPPASPPSFETPQSPLSVSLPCSMETKCLPPMQRCPKSPQQFGYSQKSTSTSLSLCSST